jgi:hypothetical protein
MKKPLITCEMGMAYFSGLFVSVFETGRKVWPAKSVGVWFHEWRSWGAILATFFLINLMWNAMWDAAVADKKHRRLS